LVAYRTKQREIFLSTFSGVLFWYMFKKKWVCIYLGFQKHRLDSVEHSTHPKRLIKFCHFLSTTCFLHCLNRFHFGKWFIFVLFSWFLWSS
jgi:hypothetical protein